MPRGQADFGMYAPKTTVAAISDIGELAVRLGSIDTYDRRGNVIFLDDFEENINKWSQVVDGIGGSIALSTDTAKNGAKSAKFVTGNVAGNECQLFRYVHYPTLSKMGIEVSTTFTLNLDYVGLYIFQDDGVDTAVAGLRYYPTLKSLKYLDSVGGWQVLDDDLTFFRSIHCFCSLKLVADFEKNTYWRARAGNQEYVFSAPIQLLGLSFFGRGLGAYLVSATNANVNVTNYWDDFIMTQNEP